MSKFSYLLVALLILNSCASAKRDKGASLIDVADANTTVASTETAVNDTIVVDKQSNSIKISSSNKKNQKPLFDWPVWEARMSRGFLPRGTRKRKKPHKGIDLAAARGSAVMSSHDGVVIYTGAGFKGYGKMIMIESIDPRDGGNWATLYGHLDKILVYEGKRVKQGEVVGALGNTGRSSGPHLHFEIRRLNGPLDPLPLLPAGEALTNDVDNGSPDE